MSTLTENVKSHLSFTCQNFPGSPSAISARSKVNVHTCRGGRAWERGYIQPQSHAFSLLLAAYLTFDPYTEQGLDCGPVMLTGYILTFETQVMWVLYINKTCAVLAKSHNLYLWHITYICKTQVSHGEVFSYLFVGSKVNMYLALPLQSITLDN